MRPTSEPTPSPSLEMGRARSPAATVTSSIHATRVLVPSRADLLPPCKRFRDSISPEDSVEEDIDTEVLEDIEADATAVKVVVDRDVEAGVYACIGMEVDVGINVEDEVESSDRGTIEVRVDVVAGIDIPDGMLIPDAMEHLEQVKEGNGYSQMDQNIAKRTKSSTRLEERKKTKLKACSSLMGQLRLVIDQALRIEDEDAPKDLEASLPAYKHPQISHNVEETSVV
uniref:Uncharacterized protein n=1 Tax=Tanacetum cinerariifolium TaxID=118510 RepID=A0A6L2JMV0_TANCI|nr:hypothetical protein [Tanacetum cinerariifolium]